MKIAIGILLTYVLLLLLSTEFNVGKIDAALAFYYFIFLLNILFFILIEKRVDVFLQKRKYKPVINYGIRLCFALVAGTIIYIAGHYLDKIVIIEDPVLTIKTLSIIPIGYIINYSIFFHENEVQK